MDVTFNTSTIAIVAAMLLSVTTALGMLFRLLVAALRERTERAEKLVDSFVPTLELLVTTSQEQGRAITQLVTLVERGQLGRRR